MPAAAVISGLVAHFEVVAVKKFVVEGHIVVWFRVRVGHFGRLQPSPQYHYAHW